MPTFGDYSRYYNLLYKDKDYSGEVEFVRKRLEEAGCQPQTLLDLGCGTGKHALEMAQQGLAVTGVDMSETMLGMGQDMLSMSNVKPKPYLLQGDARSVRLGQTFDSVTSLFHVMSYQTTLEDALAVLKTARAHLKPGGIFFFDFWHSAGVLADPPTYRERVMEDTEVLVVREATPEHRKQENIVVVNYAITITQKACAQVSHLTERHVMRYWAMPELRNLANLTNFTIGCSGGWMHGTPATKADWNAWMLLVAI